MEEIIYNLTGVKNSINYDTKLNLFTITMYTEDRSIYFTVLIKDPTEFSLGEIKQLARGAHRIRALDYV